MTLRDPIVDNTGFPMVWAEPIGAYIHWLPVTKIQFEYFLSDTTDPTFDAAWYDRLLALNPRSSAGDLRAGNYWNALLSGVRPAEAQQYARWCGEEFSLPTLAQWFGAYRWLRELEPLSGAEIELLPCRTERGRAVLRQMENAAGAAMQQARLARMRADQMLLRYGVMEWIEHPNDRYRWGGMGETLPAFHGQLFTPDSGVPARPSRPETDRLEHYGFRLVRRPA